MFAKTIIDSDAFLDMPLSAQALYFHLSMRADDEGFVNNPKKIQRMIGGSDDDLKLLCAKNFIIPFESGIVVIKHWRIHNYIRADRLISTKYQDERNQLEIKDNGAYTISGSLVELDNMDASDKRKTAYKNSSLPYSFTYKIRRAFNNKICPVCGAVMNPSYKLSMPTIQHNIPISKGGKHELDNISVICESCNTSIRDKETDALNNAEVVEMWDRINIAEKSGLDWFRNPEILETLDVSQMSVRCQSDVSIGKNRIDKVSTDKESEGKDKRYRAESEPDSAPAVITIPLNDGSEYAVKQDDFNEWLTLYPAVDVMQELRKMRGWAKANGAKRKTRKGIKRFIVNWLAREQDKPHADTQKKTGSGENPFLQMMRESENERTGNIEDTDSFTGGIPDVLPGVEGW